MKSKRKLITALITVTIVALATLSFAGCNGGVSVNPVDNSQFIKEIKTVVWNEGAKKYDNFAYDNPAISVSQLTNGTEMARYSNIYLTTKNNVFDGYEFFQVNFDITSDRDITVTLNLIYYSDPNENNLRYSKELVLQANEVSHQEWNLTKNFETYNGDKNTWICISFEDPPASGSTEFATWSQAKYTFANVEFYGLEITD